MRFITIWPKKLTDDLHETFNSGDFTRNDYKRLYVVKMWRGQMRVFLRTPSLEHVWTRTKELLFGPVHEGMQLKQLGHPESLDIFEIEDIAARYFTPEQRKRFRAEVEKKQKQQAEAARRKANKNKRKKSKRSGKNRKK